MIAGDGCACRGRRGFMLAEIVRVEWAGRRGCERDENMRMMH